MAVKLNFVQQLHEDTLHQALEWHESTANDSNYSRFALRVRSNNSKRLEKGYWFQGTESYLFFSPYSEGDTNNKTKTIGLVASLADGQVKSIHYELAFGSPDKRNDFGFYKKVGDVLGETLVPGKFSYRFGNLSTDWEKELKKFLTEKVPGINALIEKLAMEDRFFFSQMAFEKNLKRIDGVKQKGLLDVAKEETEKSQTDANDKGKNLTKQSIPYNIILYGPPGTGKTYSTIEKAVEIIDPYSAAKYKEITDSVQRRDEFRKRYEKALEDGVVRFTTFHQSFSYEDFIEGIKPVEPKETDTYLKYTVVDGVFKRSCVDSIYSIYRMASQAVGEKNRVARSADFDDLFLEFISELKKQIKSSSGEGTEFKSKTGTSLILTEINERGNLVWTTSSGARSYVVSKRRLRKLYETYDKTSQIENVVEGIRSVIGGSNATTYWASFKALKDYEKNRPDHIPEEDIDADMDYDSKSKLFGDFSVTEDDMKEMGELPRHVLIIDEINRGNIANIFGELITLVEGDKRMGMPEALVATLPYSKRELSVPPNLYIIGTMNTADRSVEALDTALRRRFEFEEVGPKIELLPAQTKEGIEVQKMLGKINSRIERLLDKDHCIGHSYLMKVEDLEGLKAAFSRQVIPLLEEYFYGDMAKIGMVLGSAFVKEMPDSETGLFPKGWQPEYPDERKVYRIKSSGEWTAEDFISVYA